jgi:hypothetical protein
MAISNKDIETYQAIHARRFGVEIGKQEAMEKGAALVHLLTIVFKPMASTEHQETQGNHNKTDKL